MRDDLIFGLLVGIFYFLIYTVFIIKIDPDVKFTLIKFFKGIFNNKSYKNIDDNLDDNILIKKIHYDNDKFYFYYLECNNTFLIFKFMEAYNTLIINNERYSETVETLNKEYNDNGYGGKFVYFSGDFTYKIPLLINKNKTQDIIAHELIHAVFNHCVKCGLEIGYGSEEWIATLVGNLYYRILKNKSIKISLFDIENDNIFRLLKKLNN